MDTQIVVVSDDRFDVLTDSAQGPPGPQGLPGTSGALSYTAGAALSGHQALVLNAEGKAVVADASVPEPQFVEAVSVAAASLDTLVVVVQTGAIEHLGWTFVTGAPVFLGLGGALVQTLPPQALFSKVLGCVALFEQALPLLSPEHTLASAASKADPQRFFQR